MLSSKVLQRPGEEIVGEHEPLLCDLLSTPPAKNIEVRTRSLTDTRKNDSELHIRQPFHSFFAGIYK